jgi:ATP/maltotriose-dependent transcriptional regulator MalT
MAAATIALARAGDLQQARARLKAAERIAGMWQGGPWLAAIWEARGVLRRSEGDHAQAAALSKEAAEHFARRDAPSMSQVPSRGRSLRLTSTTS